MMNGLGSETDKDVIEGVDCMASLPEKVQLSEEQNKASD